MRAVAKQQSDFNVYNVFRIVYLQNSSEKGVVFTIFETA